MLIFGKDPVVENKEVDVPEHPTCYTMAARSNEARCLK